MGWMCGHNREATREAHEEDDGDDDDDDDDEGPSGVVPCQAQ